VGELVSAAVHSTPGNPFVCNGPEFSTDIANLQHIVACVWHLRLQLGKLAPLDIIHKARYCDTIAGWLFVKIVRARCFVQQDVLCNVTERTAVLVLRS